MQPGEQGIELGGKVGNARQRGDQRQRKVATDPIDRGHQDTGEREVGVHAAQRPRREQKAPWRRVEIRLQPAFAERAPLRLHRLA